MPHLVALREPGLPPSVRRARRDRRNEAMSDRIHSGPAKLSDVRSYDLALNRSRSSHCCIRALSYGRYIRSGGVTESTSNPNEGLFFSVVVVNTIWPSWSVGPVKLPSALKSPVK